MLEYQTEENKAKHVKLTFHNLFQDTEVRGQMVVSLKNVSMTSSKLLVTAKSVAADPSAPNSKNQLQAAARYIFNIVFSLFSNSYNIIV